MKEYNIKIAIHNHGPEDKHFPTPQSVLEAVNALDQRCGLCMDIGHSARTGRRRGEEHRRGGRPAARYARQGSSTHPKGDKGEPVDVGDGKMPFPAIFKQLRRWAITGCVNLEYEINAKDPMLGMQRSFSYMRGVLAGLASA